MLFLSETGLVLLSYCLFFYWEIEMKIAIIATALVLAGSGFAANASTVGDIAVYATAKSQGSISIGTKEAYTKTFEIALAKLSGNDIDLSKTCLKAYAKNNQEFKLDTVDEALVSGVLKKGDMVKGIAVFADNNDAVLNAALVKISDNCH
ncbi:hypothetical protein K931_20957 [Aeromonas salmonicida subsp. pectinolytica 34mel]|nr:hypothetical protein K931_20957 [Aeromonas salmonicida subsp. pectinolytica 34mel]